MSNMMSIIPFNIYLLLSIININLLIQFIMKWFHNEISYFTFDLNTCLNYKDKVSKLK